MTVSPTDALLPVQVCDCIIFSVGGQTMEVVEHILHHITDVGFHFAFPDDWGLHDRSTLHAVMMEAVEKGLYAIDSYTKEMQQGPELTRVLLQEFGCESNTHTHRTHSHVTHPRHQPTQARTRPMLTRARAHTHTAWPPVRTRSLT